MKCFFFGKLKKQDVMLQYIKKYLSETWT